MTRPIRLAIAYVPTHAFAVLPRCALAILLATLVTLAALPAVASADTITSTLAGGPWQAGSTWQGGIVPGSDDQVIVQGPVQVYGSAACLGLEVTASGDVSNVSSGVSTLSVGTSVSNQGSIQHGSQTLSIEVGGDIDNQGSWTNFETVLTGPYDHHVNASSGSVFESALVMDAGATGDIVVETPFAILGDVDTGAGRMLLASGCALTLRGGRFSGELLAGGNEVHFESWSYLSFATVDAAVLVGEVEVSSQVSFTGGLTVMDVLQNLSSSGSAIISVSGGLVNHGEIRNQTYGLTVNLAGDLVCNGVISCSQLLLDGQSIHHLSMGPQGNLDTALFLPEFGNGTIVAETDLQVSGSIGLGEAGTLILEPGASLRFTQHGGMASGTVLADGNEIRMNGLGVLSLITVDQPVLRGAFKVGPACTFTGTAVVRDTLQSASYASPVAEFMQTMVNEGAIFDGALPLTVRVLGDAVNQGVWQNDRLVVEGDADQMLAIGTAGIDVPEIILESNLVAGPYQWFRDGQPLPGETSASLTFATLGAGDVGLYHCEGDGQPSRAIDIVIAPATGTGGASATGPGAVPALGPGRPNPFLHATSFALSLADPTPVQLAVYDVTGRLVTLLVDERLAAGEHELSWEPRETAPGVYFLRLTTGTAGAATSQVRKVTLLD